MVITALTGDQGLMGVRGADGKEGKQGKEGEDADVKFVSIKVPVCQCFQNAKGEWEVKKTTETVKAISNKAGTANNSTTIIGEYEELFKANSELCLAKNKEMEAYVSVFDYWQTRSFQKPQLAIQYAENLGNVKITGEEQSQVLAFQKPLLIPAVLKSQRQNQKLKLDND
jgi:collagen type III alpha